MSDIPSFAYELLWRERSVVSVANLTRADGDELFALEVPIHTVVEAFPLEQAEEALAALRTGHIRAAAVLAI
jgi:propanol-preferring alcohol dehydrogenase